MGRLRLARLVGSGTCHIVVADVRHDARLRPRDLVVLGLSETGVDPKQTIAVKIGGAWAVAGALWVRFYAGLREGRELRLEYQPFGRRFRGESDGDLDVVTNKARIYLPRASL